MAKVQYQNSKKLIFDPHSKEVFSVVAGTHVKEVLDTRFVDIFQRHDNLMITLEPNSSLTVYDEFSSNMKQRVFKVFIKKDAHVVFVHNQTVDLEMKESIFHFYVEQGGRLDCYAALTGKKRVHYLFDIFLLGAHASANLNGFYLLNEKQELFLETKQNHLSRQTSSNVSINGVLSGDASVLYKGAVFIDKDSCKVKSSQRNKNICIGNDTQAVAMPSMEVLNNDVECKHGSVVGGMDEEKLFYLISRGLPLKKAQSVLIESFFDFLFCSFNNQSIKERVKKNMRVKMRQML